MQRSRTNRWQWVIALTLAAVATAVITIWQRTQPAITATVSQQASDGTVTHPYSDASQCPAHTDLVFWTSSRQDPNFPDNISVCFVGNNFSEKSESNPAALGDR